MKRYRDLSTGVLAAALAAGSLSGAPQSAQAAVRPALAPAALLLFGANQSDPTSAAQSRLGRSQFKNVTAQVDANGIATLTGTVDLFEFKADAERRVSRARGVSSVRNLIQVSGPTVSDAELQSRLGEKLAYDRVGFGNVFNAIGLRVQNGVVTLGGHARTYVDRDSALALVGTYPGVRDVVDEIEVDPVSMMDDQTRMAVARAVYGHPSLNKYAIDPAKPIRISVQNGNVSLFGMVDSEADKNIANIRANSVPGVFSVRNYLQVANQPAETRK